MVLLAPGQHHTLALLSVRALAIREPQQSRGRGPDMREAGIGILLQISLQPLEWRGDRAFKGAGREDSLLVTRLTRPRQRVATAPEVALILVEGDPQGLHRVRVIQVQRGSL